MAMEKTAKINSVKAKAEKQKQIELAREAELGKKKKKEKLKTKSTILRQQIVSKAEEVKKDEVSTTNPFANSKIRLNASQMKQLENLKVPEEKVSTLDPSM